MRPTTSVILFGLLGVATSCAKPKKQPTPVENETVAPSIDAALDRDDDFAAAPIAAILQLSDAHVAAVREYEALVRKAAAAKTPALTCAALERAYGVADALQIPLLTRRDALFDGPEYDDFVAAVERISGGLYGVGFAVGAGAMYAWVDNDEFGFTADRHAMAVLSVADNLVQSYPSWMHQTTDNGGCVRLEGAATAVTRLGSEWSSAPACFREQLGPRVRDSLVAMSESLCFCDDRAAVERATATLRPLLDRVDELSGKALSSKLAANLTDARARFECSP